MNTSALRSITGALLATAGLALTTVATAGEAAPAAAAPPPAPYVIPASVPGYIRSAVEAQERTAEQKARDANRKPAEVLALSGVKPGDRVLEFAAFGQYFTSMLSHIVGDRGMVYMLDLPYTEARAGVPSRAFATQHANTRYTVADYNTTELPQNLDVVFNVLYYHDLPLNKIDTAALNRKILAALKPGGIFLVIDHNAAPGSGTRDVEKLHRIDPDVIRKEVTAAGFELVEDSKLLAHAEDDHTWMVFAPGKRGTTDQAVLKFRKPAK